MLLRVREAMCCFREPQRFFGRILVAHNYPAMAATLSAIELVVETRHGMSWLVSASVSGLRGVSSKYPEFMGDEHDSMAEDSENACFDQKMGRLAFHGGAVMPEFIFIFIFLFIFANAFSF